MGLNGNAFVGQLMGLATATIHHPATITMSRRLRLSPAPPMDDDDLLGEILLRLPPLPSALPRASLVCKRWRRLVLDPAFLRRFRAHHRRPPVLGFFSTFGYPAFTPALDPPDRIPAARFSFLPEQGGHYQFLGCRHGRALLVKRPPQPFLLLWDPVTGDQTRLEVPPELYGDGTVILTGALLCSAGDRGHAHGDCRRPGHFRVALIATVRRSHSHLLGTVYSSATSEWGEIVSIPFIRSMSRPSAAMRYFQPVITPTILIGNSIYWSYVLGRACIIEFDLDRQRPAVIEPPPDAYAHDDTVFAVMPAEDGGLGLIVVSGFRAQLWKWKAGVRRGDATWVLGRTVELDKLLPLGAAGKRKPLALVGFDEENNVTLVRTSCGIFMVHLRSMTFKRLCNSGNAKDILIYNAFPSFYAAGNGIDDRHDEGEALDDM